MFSFLYWLIIFNNFILINKLSNLRMYSCICWNNSKNFWYCLLRSLKRADKNIQNKKSYFKFDYEYTIGQIQVAMGRIEVSKQKYQRGLWYYALNTQTNKAGDKVVIENKVNKKGLWGKYLSEIFFLNL